MNQRLLLNLLMLIVVLGLVATVVYKPGIEVPTENASLTTLNSGDINHIGIIRADGTVKFERRDATWWVTGDHPMPADQHQVDRLLYLSELRPVRSYPSSELDVKQLRLEPASVIVLLNDTELHFGATEPLDSLRYVRSADRVSLINDNIQNILQGSRIQFASRKLLPEGADIVGLTIPNLKLTKTEAGRWLSEPEPKHTSADAVPKLLTAWTTTSALRVSNYQTSEHNTPVRIELANGEHLQFELRQSDNETVLARPDLGLQYHLFESTAKGLFELEQPAAESAVEPVDAEASE